MAKKNINPQSLNIHICNGCGCRLHDRAKTLCDECAAQVARQIEEILKT